MNRTLKLGTTLILFIVLCSCVRQYHSHTEPRYLRDNVSFTLNVNRPVAVKNISSSTSGTEVFLCEWGNWKVMGNLYDFTESTIGIVKEVLQRHHIIIDDKADKVLELSVDKVTCEGGWRFTATTTLKARTGNDLVKEYKGFKKYDNFYGTTATFEETMGLSVEQMLNDKDIVGYLEQ